VRAYLKGTRQTAAGLDGEAAGASQAAEVEVEAEAEVGAEAVAAVAIAGGDGISDLGGDWRDEGGSVLE
jgi:hypothetical protein